MDSQIWSKVEEKRAFILVVNGHEVHRLRVTGLLLSRKVQGILEALQQGQHPSAVGAGSVETLDARTISKAELSPSNGSLKLYGGPDGSTTLSYSTGDSDADAILESILAQSGRSFQPAKEPIGVIEALIPPAIFGVLGGLFWLALQDSAKKAAAGEVVEVNGLRRRGLKRLLISIAEMLGTSGTTAVGVVLIVLIVGWAAARIIKRPERTVLMPANA